MMDHNIFVCSPVNNGPDNMRDKNSDFLLVAVEQVVVLLRLVFVVEQQVTPSLSSLVVAVHSKMVNKMVHKLQDTQKDMLVEPSSLVEVVVEVEGCSMKVNMRENMNQDMHLDIVEPSRVVSLELVAVPTSSVKAQIAYNTKLNKMVHNFVDTEHHNVKTLHHLALTLYSSFEKGCS